ncbi:MAG: cyclic nucleotide-binding domain-containing protein [Rhodospirillales bacterium]|nr:cyclic nucleotide-binding domain-containing protein [Rhodospirillales bacterium]
MGVEIKSSFWACPMCSGPSPECLAKLDRHASASHYETGDVLFRKGEKAERLFVVVDGQVILYLDDGAPGSSIARIVARGETCGEGAICGSGTYSVTAEVLGQAKIVSIPGTILCDVLTRRFDCILQLLSTMSKQLRSLIREITDLKLKSSVQRLGHYLLGLTDETSGTTDVHLPFMKRLLAEELGMQPETLSRAFAKLRDYGVTLTKDDRVCRIEDISALRGFCQETDIEVTKGDNEAARYNGATFGREQTASVTRLTSLHQLDEAEFDLVRNVPLFSGLSADEVSDLIASASVQNFSKHQLLFSAGDVAEAFYIVLGGSVKLFVLNRDGAETIVEIVHAGHAFAEAAIFASGLFPVHAEAFEKTRLLKIQGEGFLAELRRQPKLALKMFTSLGHWQHLLMNELWHLKTQTPAQRLAWMLLTMTNAEAGSTTLTLRYPKSVIASRIGIAPESLSRALTRLSDLGVKAKGHRITIGNVESLRRFAGM